MTSIFIAMIAFFFVTNSNGRNTNQMETWAETPARKKGTPSVIFNFSTPKNLLSHLTVFLI
jgi:hypothetical protein